MAAGNKPVFYPCSSQCSAICLQQMGELGTAGENEILDQEGMCYISSKKNYCICIWLSQEGKFEDGKQQGKHIHQITNKILIGNGEVISSYSPSAANKSVAEKQDLRFLSSFLIPFCIF